MRSWIVMVVMLLIMGSVAAVSQGAGVRAGETLATDKSVYILGELMTVTIHGENNTWYTLQVDGNVMDVIRTNATGDYVGYYRVNPSNDLYVGDHTIELVSGNTVLASKDVEVRMGLELWPSAYTHSTSTYLSGETMWVKLTGEDNRTYLVNITNSTGVQVYPSNGGMEVHTNDTGVAIFQIDLNIGDDNYKLNLYNGTTYIQSKYFSVRSVEVTVSIDKGYPAVYLLSEKIHAYVSVYWLKTHSKISDAEYKWWIVDSSDPSITFGPYIGKGDDFTTYTLSDYETGTGDHIMVDRTYYLKVVYENQNATGRHYDETYVYFKTGRLNATMSMSPLDSSYSPGKKAMITINTYVKSGWDSSPLGNVHVDYINITIEKHWDILWYKNYTDYGYTDVAGKAYLIWDIPNVDKDSLIMVKAGVSVSNEHATVTYTTYMSAALGVTVRLDRTSYLAGDTMNIYLHSTHPENVALDGYEVWIYTQSQLLYYTYTSQDSLTYTLPTNYSGNVYVYAQAYFSTGDSRTDSEYATVYYGYIYLSASQDYYFDAGDQITIYSEFKSNVMHPTSLMYKVFDDSGNVVLEMNASMNEFTFTVPDASPDYYVITAEAQDGNYFAMNSIQINRFVGYLVDTHIVTNSKYQSMVFEPGQTIKIAYNITKYGEFDPHVIVLHWAIMNTNYHWEKVIGENELSGAVSLKIPTDLKGGYAILIWVSDGDNHWSTENLLTINVEKGSWAMQDIAGMPLLSFVNLILVIVAIVIGVIAILMLRKGGSKGTALTPIKKKKGPPKPYSPEGEVEEEPVGEGESVESESTTEEEELGEL